MNKADKPPARGRLVADIQWATGRVLDLDDKTVSCWLNEVARMLSLSDCEVAVRIVDTEEVADLNQRFRQRSGPTNVLSFPNGISDEDGRELLGDIVICSSVVAEQAAAQNKSFENHFAHMLVHGMLHLRGFDHVTDSEARSMEALEISLMAELGIPNPYDEKPQ